MARDRHQDDISMTFSDVHRREGADWYKWIDIDTAYYKDNSNGGIYLVVERICIKKSGVEIDDQTPEKYPLHQHKKTVIQELSERFGPDVPVFILWHRDECDPREVIDRSQIKFCVRNVDTGETLILNGWGDYWDWIDGFRLGK